jgi:hypothetical protein
MNIFTTNHWRNWITWQAFNHVLSAQLPPAIRLRLLDALRLCRIAALGPAFSDPCHDIMVTHRRLCRWSPKGRIPPQGTAPFQARPVLSVIGSTCAMPPARRTMAASPSELSGYPSSRHLITNSSPSQMIATTGRRRTGTRAIFIDAKRRCLWGSSGGKCSYHPFGNRHRRAGCSPSRPHFRVI